MLEQATTNGRLSPIHHRTTKACTSMYADDATIFNNPIKEEVAEAAQISSEFGHALGLITNSSKSAAFPICCEGLDVQDIMEAFECPIMSFPCTYVGFPLCTR